MLLRVYVMLIIRTISELRAYRGELTGSIGFVPTMGALHHGHIALMTKARSITEQLIVSIFVNPTQFAPGEDFDHYPRTWESDIKECEQAGVDMVFAPTVEEIYSPMLVPVQINVPLLAEDLEGAYRPQFFGGVCRVVAKLLNIVQPHYACFGRKDYQQLLVVDAMVRDLAMPVSIIPVDTVREEDGLAMSSRNRYLDAQHRQHALGLIKALRQANRMVQQDGETDPAIVQSAMHSTLVAHHFQVDYAVVRHPRTLKPVDTIDPDLTGGVVALLAGRLGDVRLIDNMILCSDE